MEQLNPDFVSQHQELPSSSLAPQLQMNQAVLSQLGTIDHQPTPIEPAGVDHGQSPAELEVPGITACTGSSPVVGLHDVQIQGNVTDVPGQVPGDSVSIILNEAHLDVKWSCYIIYNIIAFNWDVFNSECECL